MRGAALVCDLRALVLLLLCAPVVVLGQTGPFWEAASLLNISTPSIELRQNSIAVGSIAKADVARAVDVTQRVASAFDITTPEVIITRDRDRDPNAFVTLDKKAMADGLQDLATLLAHGRKRFLSGRTQSEGMSGGDLVRRLSARTAAEDGRLLQPREEGRDADSPERDH
jgi:hypothetical protein